MKKLIFIYMFILNFSFANDSNTTFIDNLSITRDNITDSYQQTLCDIDSYVSNDSSCRDKKYKRDISKNRVSLIFSTKLREDSVKPALYIKVNIKLPKIQDKIELTFDKQTNDEINNQNIYDSYEDRERDQNFRVGLKYYLFKKRDSKTYARLGVRASKPFGFFTQLATDKRYYLEKNRLLFGANLYYYIHYKCFTISSYESFMTPINRHYTFEQKNQIFYTHKDKSTQLEHIFRLHNFIDKKDKFTYTLNYISLHDKECQFCKKQYGISLKFKHYFKEWLFIETIPQVLARKENDFNIETRLTLNIGINFSKKPRQ